MWTLPNILTAGRLLAAPLALLAFAALERPAADAAAAAVFVAAALTDWLDGWIARRFDMGSALGRALDPIADKALVMIALAAVVGLHGLHWSVTAPVAAIVLRETLVSGLREALAGRLTLAVTPLAKLKTAAQMAALPLLLGAGALGPWAGAAAHSGAALLWLAAVLTLVTGWGYLVRAVAALREG